MKLKRTTDIKAIRTAIGRDDIEIEIVDGGVRSVRFGNPAAPVLVIGKNYYGENIECSVPEMVKKIRSTTQFHSATLSFDSEDEGDVKRWEDEIRESAPRVEFVFTREDVLVPAAE